MRRSTVLALLMVSVSSTGICRVAAAEPTADVVTISIVGTTDLHGQVFARDDNGGLALLGGYVANLRAARSADGGALLLIDAGDTFQGGIESNLSEGSVVIDAYRALGYTAAVIGNHEFDFGPSDGAGARQRLHGDPRGAVRAAAARAAFPFLAANLIDDATGRPVDWRNVHASVLVQAAGVRVGIVGVMTVDALRATLRANVQGLRVVPLAEAVAAEAVRLRAAGAELVIAAAHAGGACADFTDPADLSSCDQQSEIFRLARGLPAGLVDVIVAGHTHQGLAHEVEGIAIIQGYALGTAFGRVDVVLDRGSRRVVRHELFAPRTVCARPDATLACGPGAEPGTARPAARYEGRLVVPDPAVAAAMAPELERVRALQATPLGVVLDTPLPRTAGVESPLGNLFADAQRELAQADVAINNNVRGGLRADLPAGALTFGRLYDVFPFDNRLVRVTLSGAELRAVLADEARRNRLGALAVSGVKVRVRCATDGEHEVDVFRSDGRPIGAGERLSVVAMDSLVQGAVFQSVRPPDGFEVKHDAPVMREVVEDWLRGRGGHLESRRFATPDQPRWEYSGANPAGCGAP